MTDGWQFVVPGYLIVFGGLALYAIWMLRRARTVAQQVPEEKRRFLD